MGMSCRPAAAALAAFAVGISLSGRSEAHIDLLSPPPRAGGIPDGNLLRGPCGQRNDARVTERVSTFRPGESIDVEWDVYVQHVSYFRISFDTDGDDSFSSRTSPPSDPADDDLSRLAPADGEIILGYIPDPTAQRDHIKERITLPNLQCDNCTLQVTQFTYGLPVKDAVYYQCADLVLAGELMTTPASADRPSSAAADAGGPDTPASRAPLDPGFVGSGDGCSLALGSVGAHPRATSPGEPSSPGSAPRPSRGAIVMAAALIAAIAGSARRASAAS
jgi:hypothetical protein